MTRISDKKIEGMVKAMQYAASGGPKTWDPWYDEHAFQTVYLEFPGGELLNPNIEGFLWAWKLQKAIKPRRLEQGDRFNANGLEGKIQIRTSLVTALTVWNELPRHRCQIIA